MRTLLPRLLAPVLAALLAAACTAQPAPPTAAPSPSSPPAITPTATLPATPTPAATTSPSGSPTQAPSPSPTVTPSPTLSPPAAYDPEALMGQLETELERQRSRFGLIGLGATVVMPDGLAWSGGSGSAHVDPGLPATGDTPFVVGSITKTFVAALVMQLAEEGVLSLDDPLSRWLPDYRRHNDATLRQLLAHTSGIYNYFEHPAYNRRVFADPEPDWTPQEILTEFGAPPYFEAGSGYHYSNTGFVLLGLVIEEATGNSLEEELQARLFEPLGLEDTYFGGGTDTAPATSAHGYLVGRNGVRLISDGTSYRPTRSAATVAWAAGAIVASAPDLATWARALYDGDEVVAAEYVAQMTDFAANPYSGLEYGLGTRTRILNGHRMVGHTGSLRGFAAAMWHFPDLDVTVVVLSNRGRIDVNPVADALARVALDAVGYLP